jgi:hypothetical protein
MESTDDFDVRVAGNLPQAPEVLSIIGMSVQKLFGLVRSSIQNVQGVKVTTSGFNSRADSESKMSYTHMGTICSGSGVMSF